MGFFCGELSSGRTRLRNVVNKGKNAAGKDLGLLSTFLVLVRAHLFLFAGDQPVQEV